MEFRNTIEAIIADSKEFTGLLQRIEVEPKLAIIDLDLALQKLRHMYELVLDIRNETLNPTNNSIINTPTAISNSPTVNDVSKVASDVAASIEKRVVEQVTEQVDNSSFPKAAEPVSESMGQVTVTETPLEIKINEPASQTSVTDESKAEKPKLNEALAQRIKSDEPAWKQKAKPITSITGTMGLNERFEFMNHLFNNDKSKFDNTLEILNTAHSYDEAFQYLKETFNWDIENIHVQRFLEFLQRKLMAQNHDK